MKRYLVTGGAGFIGSAVVRNLVGNGKGDVLNVDALTYAGRLENIADVSDSPNHTFLKADIADGAEMLQAFTEFRPDAVIHLAAETHVDRSIEGVSPFLQTNVIGTTSLLNAATTYWSDLPRDRQEAFRFLHVSTDEVFGTLGDEGAFNEKSPYRPNSPYSASKASADHFVRAWQRTYGLPTIISNCSNNYGPYQYPEKLIPVVVLAALEGRPIPVYGTGANVRDWLFVEDHVQALLTILDQGVPGQEYCVGGDCEISNLELVRTICGLMDDLVAREGRPHADLIQFVSDRPGHDYRYAIDMSKITRELGWRPSTTVAEGLRRTVVWYLENQEWWSPVVSSSRERRGLAARSDGDA